MIFCVFTLLPLMRRKTYMPGVIHVVGSDIDEIGVDAANGNTHAYTQIGEAHVSDVVNTAIAHKNGVETYDTAIHVL